jgi:hypothetical protein
MRRLVVALGALAVLAVGGVALAQTTGNERIYACVNNGDGTIRQVAGADTACPKGWHNLSWSAENPPATTIPETTTYVIRGERTINAQAVGVGVDTFCNSGDVATGGGFESFSPVLEVRSSTPLPPHDGDDPNGWRVNVRKTDTVEEPTVSVFVVCQHTE